MLIGKRYKIESDELNITLYEKIKKTYKKGNKAGQSELVWQVLGYYSSVANALMGLVNMEVMKTGLKDLDSVMKRIDELEKMIKAALNENAK